LTIYKKEVCLFSKEINPHNLRHKANQFWVDWRGFMRGINELCGSLKDNTKPEKSS